MAQDYGNTALKAGAITGLSQVAKLLLQLVSVVLLSRLLDPTDFGLMAAAGPFIAFVALFQNLGFQQAVIQDQTLTHSQMNSLFWVSFLTGVCCASVLIFAAPAIGAFYGDSRIGWLAAASSLPIILGSVSTLPLGLLSRDMKFGNLAFNDVASTAGGLAATAISALAGLGYWSLIVGACATATLSLALSWRSSGWRPGVPTIRTERRLFSFGANLTGFNVVNFFSRNLDNVMIGHAFGSTELGFYDRAYKLFMAPIKNVNAPIGRVMLPILSKIQNDKPRLRSVYLQSNWLLAAATVPCMTAVAIVPEETVRFLLGEKWLAASPILFWLAIAGFLQPVSNATGWLFICQGKTKQMFRWGFFSSATAIASFAVGLNWGATGVAAAYAISGFAIRLPALAFVMHKIGPVRAPDLLALQGLFSLSAMISWALFSCLPVRIDHDLARIATSAIISYTTASALIWAFPFPRSCLMSFLLRLHGLCRSAER